MYSYFSIIVFKSNTEANAHNNSKIEIDSLPLSAGSLFAVVVAVVVEVGSVLLFAAAATRWATTSATRQGEEAHGSEFEACDLAELAA